MGETGQKLHTNVQYSQNFHTTFQFLYPWIQKQLTVDSWQLTVDNSKQ